VSISINWGTKVIYVPKSFLTLIGGSIYELDTNDFRLALKDLEDDPEGMPFPKTHNHNTEVTLGGLSYARVIEILPPYTVTFEDGQYAVNLIGSNNNIADRTNVNQVSVRPNNSAGLISSKGIESLEYRGGVTINVANGVAGTLYPIGTLRRPVNNLPDAIFIANSRGYDTIYVLGDLTVNSGDTLDNLLIIGENPIYTTITLNSGCSTDNTLFKECTIQGTLDGDISLECCIIMDINYFDGTIRGCMLKGNIVLAGNITAIICDCVDGWADGTKPIIDMGGSGRNLIIARYSGDILIKNLNGNQFVSIDLLSGDVYLDSTITAGTFEIRGVGELVQNFSNGAIVYTDGLTNPKNVSDTIVNSTEFINVVDLVKQLREGNIKYEFIKATSVNLTRNVAIGVVDYMIIKYKNDDDVDWSVPIKTEYLYYWYEVIGNSNPIYVGESD